MATITLSLSEKIDEFQRSGILIRFSASATQRYRVKSGLFVASKRWTKRNEISIPKIENKERTELLNLSSKLDSLTKYIMKAYEITDKALLDKDWLDTCIDRFHFPEKYIAVDEVGPTIHVLFDDFLSKKKVSIGRINQFKVFGRSLKRFELFIRKTDSTYVLDIETMNEDTLTEFETFLKNEHVTSKLYPDIYKAVAESREPEPRGQNTCNGILKKFRTFIKWENDSGRIRNNPFLHFTIDEAIYGTPYYITIAERNMLYNHDLSKRPGLAVQRDIFVFQCLIGCRVGDFFRMTKSNLISGAIEYIASKSKEGNPVTVRVPLNTMAKEIYEKYKDEDNEMLLPFISEQKYNVAIKAAFTLAGLTRVVTVLNPTTRIEEKRPLNEVASSHMARRAFIGNLYKQVKDPSLIAPLSGHIDGSKAFARYREIDEEMKIELVDMLL